MTKGIYYSSSQNPNDSNRWPSIEVSVDDVNNINGAVGTQQNHYFSRKENGKLYFRDKLAMTFKNEVNLGSGASDDWNLIGWK